MVKPEGSLHINSLELKAVLLAFKQFKHLCWGKTILVCTDNTTVASYINNEGGEIRLSLCPAMEAPALVQSKGDSIESQAHSWSPKCHSRKAVPTQIGDPDKVVSP